jgi:hypothetical protein
MPNEKKPGTTKPRGAKTTHRSKVMSLARALSPPDKKQFCAVARLGTRTRQLICFAKSELGAKRIAGRFYREMYPDRTVTVLSVDQL